jgi:hypothetical protein
LAGSNAAHLKIWRVLGALYSPCGVTNLPSARRALRLVVGIALAAAVIGAGAAAAPPPTEHQYEFVSEPGLHPPRLKVLERRRGLSSGDFLLSSFDARGAGTGQSGPLIVDGSARPVWFLHLRAPGTEFEQETYRGKPVLVFANGRAMVVMNEHYRTVAKVKAHHPWLIDGHDAQIIGDDMWVTVIRRVGANLNQYGGPANGLVLDCGIQEYDVKNDHLIRTWDALNPQGKPNVPLSASKQPVSSFWDAYHLNSVQPLPNGHVLVSMRNTWAVYLINPVSDRTVWTLGGNRSSFRLGHDSRFSWQHDARLLDPAGNGRGTDVKLSLFDDNSRHRSAKGMVLRLNTRTLRAALVDAYPHLPRLRVPVMGSMQELPNKNAVIGWGAKPYFSEYSSTGKQLLDVKWPSGDNSYRARLTDTWVGRPFYPPRGAVRGTTAYASWNGATQVVKWQVLAGGSPGQLRVVASKLRTGFETAVPLPHRYGAYEVRALGASGLILGTSRAFS